MAFRGEDVIEIGSTRVGQKYVLGAQVPLNNPNWKGPWDCAEFTSWCAYQAYQIIFGAGNTSNVSKAEPYSGSWATDAKKRGTVIGWKEALKIPGAALIRAPSGKIGHVAFSMGDNDRTLEARGAAYGVGIFKGAAKRAWSMGCLLPGVEYTSGKKGLVVTPAAVAPTPFADEYLWLKAPKFKDARVVAVQSALRAKGIDPGPIDGELGPMTNAAIVTFQIVKGLAVDGVVGEETAEALTLAFPIVPAPKHKRCVRRGRITARAEPGQDHVGAGRFRRRCRHHAERQDIPGEDDVRILIHRRHDDILYRRHKPCRPLSGRDGDPGQPAVRCL